MRAPSTAMDSSKRLSGSRLDDVFRRVLDLVVALVGLVLLAVPMGVIAAAVRLTSPGPAMFRQQRVGREGRLFSLLKFRTMSVGSTGPNVTARSDSRITPVGHRLRHWKLDELPQLINVLRGDMSLVGPRPEVPQYVNYYTGEQRQVLQALPGITGPCQLVFRNEESVLCESLNPEAFYIQFLMPMKLGMDLYYVQQRSLADDFRVLWQTVGAIAGWSQSLETLVLCRRDAR